MRSFQHSLLVSAALFAPIGLVPAHAEDPLAASDKLKVTLSASPSTRPIDVARAGTAVSVILAEDMEKQGISTITDALRFVPGLSISSSGSKGSESAVRIRGGETAHTLIVIDGVAMNAPNIGTFDVSQIPLNDVERIEVLRGPQSGIYGSNAHAGVVSIITKSGKGLKRAQASALFEVGSQNSLNGAATYANAHGPAYGSLSVQGFQTQGANISRTGDEKDGSRMGSMAARFGFDFNESYNLESSVRFVRRDNDSDGGYGANDTIADSFDVSKRDDLIGTLALTGRYWGGNLITQLYANGYSSRLSYDSASFDSQNDSTRTQIGGKATYYFALPALNAHQSLTLFTENTRENFTTSYVASWGGQPPIKAGRASTGLGAEYRVDFKNGLSLSGALRNDFNDVFKDALTWRGTMAYQLAATDTTLHASIGRGSTNPTFYQQFGYGLNFIGNPALKPESSIGYDIGVSQSFLKGRLWADLTYFSSDTTDSITGSGSSVVNLSGTTRRQGIEASSRFALTKELDLNASYTYTDGQLANGDPLIRRARNAGSIDVVSHWLERRLTAAVGAHFIGTRQDKVFAFPSYYTTLPATTLINARLAYQLNKQTQLYVRGENLLNDKYEDVYSYRAAGAVIFAGFKSNIGE